MLLARLIGEVLVSSRLTEAPEAGRVGVTSGPRGGKTRATGEVSLRIGEIGPRLGLTEPALSAISCWIGRWFRLTLLPLTVA